MKDGGHSDGKCKKCGTLRRGLLALFPGEGMTLGNTFLTLLIVSVERSHPGLLGWCRIRVCVSSPWPLSCHCLLLNGSFFLAEASQENFL